MGGRKWLSGGVVEWRSGGTEAGSVGRGTEERGGEPRGGLGFGGDGGLVGVCDRMLPPLSGGALFALV